MLTSSRTYAASGGVCRAGRVGSCLHVELQASQSRRHRHRPRLRPRFRQAHHQQGRRVVRLRPRPRRLHRRCSPRHVESAYRVRHRARAVQRNGRSARAGRRRTQLVHTASAPVARAPSTPISCPSLVCLTRPQSRPRCKLLSRRLSPPIRKTSHRTAPCAGPACGSGDFQADFTTSRADSVVVSGTLDDLDVPSRWGAPDDATHRCDRRRNEWRHHHAVRSYSSARPSRPSLRRRQRRQRRSSTRSAATSMKSKPSSRTASHRPPTTTWAPRSGRWAS